MTRTELIAEVKVKGIKTIRPAHMMSTVDLEKIIADSVKGKVKVVRKVKEDSMKVRILNLHKEGLSVKEIREVLVGEGWGEKMKCGTVRDIYIKFVLKNNQ